MTTPIAIVLATAVIVALGVDTMMYGNQHLIFLVKKFVDLIEWVAFWRCPGRGPIRKPTNPHAPPRHRLTYREIHEC